MINSILITIASFLDYEIYYTILDCVQKAKYPKNLRVSVLLQYDENQGTDSACLDELAKQYNITIEKHHYLQSEGGCWARQKCQQHYNGEDYVLQIDAHTRFIKNWDDIVIKNIQDLKKYSDKPMLSYMPPSYLRNDKLGIDYEFVNLNQLDRINIPTPKFISAEGWIDYVGYDNQINTNFQNIRVPLLYGCFVFAEGSWVVDVEQDPLHYYTGEELALAIRSFTKGYDIYLPTQIVAWHRAHPTTNKKHFNTFSSEIAAKKHSVAINRLQKLLLNEDLGKYGLGKVRTLEEYENFSRIDFKNRTLK